MKKFLIVLSLVMVGCGENGYHEPQIPQIQHEKMAEYVNPLEKEFTEEALRGKEIEVGNRPAFQSPYTREFFQEDEESFTDPTDSHEEGLAKWPGQNMWRYDLGDEDERRWSQYIKQTQKEEGY